MRGWTVLHLPLSLKVLWNQVGRKAPELGHAATPGVSPHITAGDQVPPYPRPLPHGGGCPHEDEYAEVHKDDAEVLSDGQAGSDGDEGVGHTQIQTPSLV